MIMGEYAVAVNASPRLWMSAIEFVMNSILHIGVPKRYFKFLPKVQSWLKIKDTTSSFRYVKDELENLYEEEGNYFLGRLSGPEVEELRDTNYIPGRIESKDNFKWKIMRSNYNDLVREKREANFVGPKEEKYIFAF